MAYHQDTGVNAANSPRNESKKVLGPAYGSGEKSSTDQGEVLEFPQHRRHSVTFKLVVRQEIEVRK